MTQKNPRYRIIKSYDSVGDEVFYAQRNIFGIWIGCRWLDGHFGPRSCYLENVEKYVEIKLNIYEKRNQGIEVVKVYE